MVSGASNKEVGHWSGGRMRATTMVAPNCGGSTGSNSKSREGQVFCAPARRAAPAAPLSRNRRPSATDCRLVHRLLLIERVGCGSRLGVLVHPTRAHLELKACAGRQEQRNVKRAIAVWLGRRDVVPEGKLVPQ
eukprot:scaffold16206_cov134-Isochrysis_galbana.AAC.1